MEKIILASNSASRKEILSKMHIEFEIMPSDIDEEEIINGEVSPFDAVKKIALQKGMSICEKVNTDAIIIAADTVASLNGRILGKPNDADDAFSMIRRLQGKSHSVYTGVCIIKKTPEGVQLENFVDTTTVFIRKLAETEIWDYVRTGEPLDKAGSMDINGIGSVLIERIEGDFFNVMGLPIARVYTVLNELGLNLAKYWTNPKR